MQDNLIPFERMKDIIVSELNAFSGQANGPADITVEYLKGFAQIKFPLNPLTDIMLFDSLEVLKNHIANIRIISFEKGHYSFQAMNSNIFNTENLTDNFKVDFFSLVNSFAEATKKGDMSMEEINSVIEVYKKVNAGLSFNPETRIKDLGASVINGELCPDWDYIAGYSETKRKIRETVILPVKNPGVYDTVMRMTRKSPESNIPRAVLFEGPPGVGKTTAARIIAHESSVPLVYVPVESIMSKWYGESSRNMADIFDMCEMMGGAVIFLDEIDSLAGSRDQNMFEATRRILSVLLRKLDGIDPAEKTITIGATNRMVDLDPALLSRFDQIIKFPYPNEEERSAIFSNYARHLSVEECTHLSQKSPNLTGRNIKDICEQAERRWVRKILAKSMEAAPPPFDYYRHSLQTWKNSQIQ